MRGVVRIQIERPKKTYGWQARQYLKTATVTHFFSDSHYGGKQGAYEAACLAREQMEQGIDLPKRAAGKGSRTAPASAASGKIGVSEAEG